MPEADRRRIFRRDAARTPLLPELHWQGELRIQDGDAPPQVPALAWSSCSPDLRSPPNRRGLPSVPSTAPNDPDKTCRDQGVDSARMRKQAQPRKPAHAGFRPAALELQMIRRMRPRRQARSMMLLQMRATKRQRDGAFRHDGEQLSHDV